MFVVDASAVLKLVLEEDGTEAAERFFMEVEKAGTPLLSVPLLAFEVGNVLIRNLRQHADELASLHEQLLARIQLKPVEAAKIFAVRGTLSYYDASYLALAQQEGATLVTADGDLVRGARRLSIPVLRL